MRQCRYDGLGYYTWGTCAGNTYCLAQNGSVSCERKPCDAGSSACLSEQLGKCAADGMSLESVSADCAAQGKLCTIAGCAAQAVDALGAGDQIGVTGQPLLGNLIQVQAGRTLTQIEAYLTLPGSRALTWAVYEGGTNNTFTLVASSATVASGTGFQSSGAISYALKPGRSYFIGVNVTGTYVAYFSSQSEAELLSFGTAEGAMLAYSLSSLLYGNVNPSQLYYLKLTTTP
jgi:hypothetical protein